MTGSTAVRLTLAGLAGAAVALLIAQALRPEPRDEDCVATLKLSFDAKGTKIIPNAVNDPTSVTNDGRLAIVREELKKLEKYDVLISFGPAECTHFRPEKEEACANPPLDAIHATQTIDFSAGQECSKEELVTSLGIVQALEFKVATELPGLSGEPKDQLRRLLQEKSTEGYLVRLNPGPTGNACWEFTAKNSGHPVPCQATQSIHATQRIPFLDQAERREFLQALQLDPLDPKYGH